MTNKLDVQIIDSDWTLFHDQVKPQDRLLIMTPSTTVYGIFSGCTDGRFNLEEQCLDLTSATVLAPVFDRTKPLEVNQVLSQLNIEMHQPQVVVNVDNRDFLMVRTREFQDQ